MSRNYTADHKVIVECFLCKQGFQFGPHAYNGRRIAAWDIMVCKSCDDGNWDGVVTESHPDLLQHLETRGIEIRLNEKGWLDLPKRGAT
jgi:hypothetical protein